MAKIIKTKKTDSKNVYWPVYKILEKEVLELAQSIHFTDQQIRVYSLKIADLIMRCSTELESLVKDIFRLDNNKEPENPGECFLWLDKNWNISKKEILIATPYFYFEKVFCPTFQPFNYSAKSEDDYYSIYNSIKHDRQKNLYKANINILIRVLGALYVLNLYHKKDIISLDDDDRFGDKMDKSGASEVFNFQVAPTKEGESFTSNQGIIKNNCIYRIEEREGLFAFKLRFINEDNKQRTSHSVMTNNSFQVIASSMENKSISFDEYSKIMNELTGNEPESLRQHFIQHYKVKTFLNVTAVKMKDSYCAVLNK